MDTTLATRRAARRTALSALAVAMGFAAGAAAHAQAMPQGFLCCNMRAEGDWISDINYRDGGLRLVPAGTPARVTGYGRHRVALDLGNERARLGNDYSRTLTNEEFAARYVVAEDPKARLASWSPEVRKAVTAAQVIPGMTREQVIMSLGYPVTSENPAERTFWRYWVSSFDEFQVVWGPDGRVKAVETASPTARRLVIPEGN